LKISGDSSRVTFRLPRGHDLRQSSISDRCAHR
jgi:hypothetical protein